jgi:hypothetical protein
MAHNRKAAGCGRQSAAAAVISVAAATSFETYFWAGQGGAILAQVQSFLPEVAADGWQAKAPSAHPTTMPLHLLIDAGLPSIATQLEKKPQAACAAPAAGTSQQTTRSSPACESARTCTAAAASNAMTTKAIIDNFTIDSPTDLCILVPIQAGSAADDGERCAQSA